MTGPDCSQAQMPAEAAKGFGYQDVVQPARAREAAYLGPVGDLASTPSDIEDGVSDGKGTKRFIVDLAYYQSEPDRLELVATATAGAITTKILTFNAPLKGVRAIVDATLPDDQSAELRMFLRVRSRTLSETWTVTRSVPSGDSARQQSPKTEPRRK